MEPAVDGRDAPARLAIGFRDLGRRHAGAYNHKITRVRHDLSSTENSLSEMRRPARLLSRRLLVNAMRAEHRA
jgi:hypothetical protein